MQQTYPVEFKTLLTSEEYSRILAKYKDCQKDLQTNHYLDTERFTLKAIDSSLRVRNRDNYQLTFKRKKGYAMQEYVEEITKEEFEEIKKTGVLPQSELAQEVKNIIGDQKLENFMSFSTDRICVQYGNGIIYLDKNSYLGFTDYELLYEAKNQYDGKKEFIALLADLQIKYKKSEKKIKRAYLALKTL